MHYPKLLRRSAIQKLLPISTSAIYDRIKLGIFPPNISLGGKAVAWIEEEVHTVINEMVMGATKDELRQLVTKLVAERTELIRDFR